MKVNEDILSLIGNTPLVRLRTGIPADGPRAYVKLEFYNPTGSVKDRMAYHILKTAIDRGELKKGDTVIDNTSGNTGSAVGMIAVLLGLKAIIVTPEKTSQEKVDLIKSYGVKVLITPTEAAHDDPEGCYMTARRLASENGFYDLNQYDNQVNVESHYLTTGPEIWNDTDGKITHFVCGIGTGGTLSGTAKYLKEQNKNIKIIAVDPAGSVFADHIRGEKLPEPITYKIEGIGSDVVTKALHTNYIDDVITVSDKDAFIRARQISKAEGISAGGSSGAVAVAIEKVACSTNRDSIIIGIFADGGIRYMSKCFNDEWMMREGFLEQVEELNK